MRQMRKKKGCDEDHWHAHTRGLPWDLSEVVGTVKMHCGRGRLLRRGLEFQVCTINKSAHSKKYLETYLIILVTYRIRQRCMFIHVAFESYTRQRVSAPTNIIRAATVNILHGLYCFGDMIYARGVHRKQNALQKYCFNSKITKWNADDETNHKWHNDYFNLR